MVVGVLSPWQEEMQAQRIFGRILEMHKKL